MTRYATIPADGRFAAFHYEDGSRAAVGMAQTAHSIGYRGPPTLCLMVADPAGHPFDGSPLALLDPERVEQMRDALTEWLEQA